MKAHFAPCESCGRHIRVSEASCPFCDGVTSATFRARPAPQPSTKRLSRAALLVFSAATAGAGCSSSSDTPSTTTDTGADTGSPVVDAAYGGPPDTGAKDSEADAADTGIPTVDAAYGGPPDTGSPDAAADTSPAPAYGLPPPDAGDGG
jgi:hypothetical protein